MTLNWYFDVLSPFAYLQLEWLRRDWPTVELQPRPVLLGVILSRIGQLGPAEIPGKREFTYRYVHWRARELGIPLRFPPVHPFNPLNALRLIIAAGSTLRATELVFRHLWRDGLSAEPEPLIRLCAELNLDPDALAATAVKEALKHNTEAALARGIFGVPTLEVHGELFFGQDATPFAMAALADPTLLTAEPYKSAGSIPVGVSRSR